MLCQVWNYPENLKILSFKLVRNRYCPKFTASEEKILNEFVERSLPENKGRNWSMH